MTDAIRPLIAGNWKMNGLKSSEAEFDAMREGAGAVAAKAVLLVCPPATLIAGLAGRAKGSELGIGVRSNTRESQDDSLPGIFRQIAHLHGGSWGRQRGHGAGFAAIDVTALQGFVAAGG